MITDDGKRILGKYLIGHAPAYASYMAFGCGATAHSTTDFTQQEIDSFATKQSLDFEMFRVPIISRGIVTNDAGTSEIVLTAELPTEERYEITEVGIFSAGSDPSAASTDSRSLYSFTSNENWEFHSAASATSITSKNEALDANNDDNSMDTSVPNVFQSNADNSFFDNDFRVERSERCRFLNRIIALRGDVSELVPPLTNDGHILITGNDHIHLTGIALNLDKNSPSDELRVAFSVVNRWGELVADKPADPSKVVLLIEFASSETEASVDFARFEIVLENGVLDHANGTHPWAENRYAIVSKQLQGLYKSAGFDWGDVRLVKVYATVYVDDVVSEDFYVCLDSIRLERDAIGRNALYGMTGYTVIQTANALPIVKEPNTTNLAEFRFALDVI
jgi:hypothetical protein